MKGDAAGPKVQEEVAMKRSLVSALVLSGALMGGQVVFGDEHFPPPDQPSAAEPSRAADGAIIRGKSVEPKLDRTARAARPWLASKTIGLAVKNATGEDLGRVQELVFDQESGCIRYAVVAVGGFLGVGDKLLAVPWKNMQVRHDAQSGEYHMMLNITKERLEAAPGFDRDNYPEFGDPTLGAAADVPLDADRPSQLPEERRSP
jgi:hypothetical protein